MTGRQSGGPAAGGQTKDRTRAVLRFAAGAFAFALFAVFRAWITLDEDFSRPYWVVVAVVSAVLSCGALVWGLVLRRRARRDGH